MLLRFQFGNTPLYRAVNEGYGDIAEVLVCAGADINIANKVSDTCPVFLRCNATVGL